MENLKETVEFSDVTKLDIRIGRVTNAERIPKSTKLLKLTVDFGTDVRTVVTNLGETIEPIAFEGRTMPFIVNLAPVKMMGVTSEAMIMAMSSPETKEPMLFRPVGGEPGDIVL